jgi:hypothetical protein
MRFEVVFHLLTLIDKVLLGHPNHHQLHFLRHPSPKLLKLYVQPNVVTLTLLMFSHFTGRGPGILCTSDSELAYGCYVAFGYTWIPNKMTCELWFPRST